MCVYALLCSEMKHMQCLLDDSLCAATSTFDIRFCVCVMAVCLAVFYVWWRFFCRYLSKSIIITYSLGFLVFVALHTILLKYKIFNIRAFWSQSVHVLFISFFLHYRTSFLDCYFVFICKALSHPIFLWQYAAVLNLYFCVSMCVCVLFFQPTPSPHSSAVN